MATIINCKELSSKLRQDIKRETADWGVAPGLAVIIIGDNPASKTYVNNKKKACDEVGFHSEVYQLNDTVSTDEVIALVDKLNRKDDIDGILVQLPLPPHIGSKAVLDAVSTTKDADALSENNMGKLLLGTQVIAPCTPIGIMDILDSQQIKADGKHCVIVGRSDIVGKPMACLMLQRNATVTVCHSHTENLTEICKQADILIVAVGKANFITADMVKPDAVVIDVGINRNADNRLVGDVAFDDVVHKASYITPVPGGVGVMTVTSLLKNTLKLAQQRRTTDEISSDK